ncbi:MAG: hypothetical protein HKN07_15345 [Acidimicrobiia bacterium]|nr:hypothetical protein [Acidimicrobiia bacterium]
MSDATYEPETTPLRERIVDYARVFGFGLVTCVIVGIIGGVITGSPWLAAIGSVSVGLGVLYLLAGGARGGGYTNMGAGAVGALFGGRNQDDEEIAEDDVRLGGGTKGVYEKRKGRDPMNRLRKGLRPGPNPSAFWQVIGGFAYLAIGVYLLSTFG